jgi:hypothetical protein
MDAIDRPQPPHRLTLTLRRHPGLVIVPAVLGLSALLGDGVEHGPVLCPLRFLTGLPCAGCGMTRAFVALAHGRLTHALSFNLLAPLLFAWLAGWWLLALVRLGQGRPMPDAPPWLVKVAFFGLSGYWLARTVAFVAAPDVLQRMAQDSPLVRWLLS